MHEALDPRILRSRRMLHEALATLLRSKDFDKISIGEIAEAATINRATFYDHYPDKFALLQCLVGARFAQLLAIRNVRTGDCAGAVRAMALGLCDYLAEMPPERSNSHESSMQSAIVGVIERMMREGLPKRSFEANVSPEVLASTISWAMYGAAIAWTRTPRRCSAEDMADAIDALVHPILAREPAPHGEEIEARSGA